MLKYAFPIVGVEILRLCGSLLTTVYIAYAFGATSETDAFFLIYIFIFRIGERIRKCINVSFVPVYVEYNLYRDKAETNKMTNAFVTEALIFSILLAIGYTVFSPYWLKIVAFGLDDEARKVAVKLTWILSPVIILFVCFSICESLFISKKKYLISPLATLFSTAGPLLFILLLGKYIGIYSIAIGTLVGVVLTFAVPYSLLARKELRYSVTVDIKEEGAQRIKKNLIPIMCYNILLLMVIIIDRVFATRLGEGYPSALSYAFNISILIPTLITPAVLVSVLPGISENIAKKDYKSFSALFIQAFKFIAFIVVPGCTLLFLLKDSIIAVILQHGKFDMVALGNTVVAFKYYIIGIPAYSLWGLVAGILVSMGKVKHLIGASLFLLAVSIATNALFMKWFGYVGLPIATSIIFFIQFGAFVLYLNADDRFYGFQGFFYHFIKILFATLCMAFLVSILKGFFVTEEIGAMNLIYKILYIGVLITSGSVCYITLAKLIKIESVSFAFEVIQKKIQ